ncbi:MAG: metallophosphoesterase [Armatimonadota bacterium]
MKRSALHNQVQQLLPSSGVSRREVIRTGLFTAAALSLADLRHARPGWAQAGECLFAIIGDYGWSGTAERDVANLVKSWSPELIVTAGDNNYGDAVYANGSVETIDKNVGQYYHEYIHPYRGSYGAGADTNRFFPAVADKEWHPTLGYQAHLDYFTLPHNERYYDFVWGPVHFFILNSEKHEPDGAKHPSVQSAWLQRQLAASTAPWKIVVCHNPPYATRGGLARMQWPFKEWGAHAVISGQHHVYERLEVGGLTYVINGLGGRSRGNFDGLQPAAGSLVRYGADYGAQRVTAASDRITFEFFSRAGQLVDSFTLWGELPLAAPTQLQASPTAGTLINLTWVDQTSGEETFELERSRDGASFSLIAVLGANSTSFADETGTPATTFYYRVRAAAGTRYSQYSNVASATTPASTGGTNLLANSEQFERWVMREGCTVVPNVAAAPNLTMTADRIDDSPSTAGYPAIYADVTVPTTGPYVFSCYFQAESLRQATVRIDNLITKLRLVEAPLTLPTGSWERFTVPLGEITAGHKVRIYLYPGQYRREGGSVLAWGAQLERGSTAGPYLRSLSSPPRRRMPLRPRRRLVNR